MLGFTAGFGLGLRWELRLGLGSWLEVGLGIVLGMGMLEPVDIIACRAL